MTDQLSVVSRQFPGYGNQEFNEIDPAFMSRLRWRCRRGLLELDIVLGRFVDAQYATLDEAERATFDVMLNNPDTLLWDMIAGTRDVSQIEQQRLLEKIRIA